jgi:hypothetical protein
MEVAIPGRISSRAAIPERSSWRVAWVPISRARLWRAAAIGLHSGKREIVSIGLDFDRSWEGKKLGRGSVGEEEKEERAEGGGVGQGGAALVVTEVGEPEVLRRPCTREGKYIKKKIIGTAMWGRS